MYSVMVLTLCCEVEATPVVMMFMSISPVVGSVALCCMAVLIRRTASSMSYFSTASDKRILATDSEIRMSDSSCLGVAVIVFLLFPIALIFWYSLTSTITYSSPMLGITIRRA